MIFEKITKLDISLKLGELIETATIEIHRQESTLTFTKQSGFRKNHTNHDLYLCLAHIRQEFPEIQFLCKGAKLNVTPSSAPK